MALLYIQWSWWEEKKLALNSFDYTLIIYPIKNELVFDGSSMIC